MVSDPQANPPSGPIIRTFVPGDATEVRDLFASGITEFGVGVEAEVRKYVERSLNADLADIPANYLADPMGHFWVAETAAGVMGMVGIQRVSDEEAELRRMSVSSAARRQGIGWGLLETTERFCREHGYQRIALSTVTILQPAIAMYQRFGFELVKEEDYGELKVKCLSKELARGG